MDTWFGESEMTELIDDRDEAAAVLQSIMERANLGELIEPLSPSDASLDSLMHVGADEEAEIELINHEGQPVAVLYVDVLDDPSNRWTIKLRGWKLSDSVASV